MGTSGRTLCPRSNWSRITGINYINFHR